MCFVRLFLRITKCFLRFFGKDYSKPLCICCDALGKLRYVTASDVNFVFRLAATQVYTLDPSADKALLDRWSSHSLRVDACVILHAMGFTNTQIMWLLRWKSNVFMTYLRNVAVLAHNQNIAFSEVEAMPQNYLKFWDYLSVFLYITFTFFRSLSFLTLRYPLLFPFLYSFIIYL
jgi:hypothetical protein